MKILAITDVHGAYRTVEAILARAGKIDVFVIGGDFTVFGGPKEVEESVRSWGKFQVPMLAVSGNMDIPEVDRSLEKLGVSINGKGVVIEGVGFFGVSAAPYSPLHTPYEISEEEIGRRIQAGYEQVKGAGVKIFVPHAPPYKTKVDKISMGLHVGSKAVREFIEREQPHVCICGHIHEARGQDTIGQTKVVNCGLGKSGYYVLIDIEKIITIQNREYQRT